VKQSDLSQSSLSTQSFFIEISSGRSFYMANEARLAFLISRKARQVRKVFLIGISSGRSFCMAHEVRLAFPKAACRANEGQICSLGIAVMG
jgi:hypothetical protein